MPNILALLLFCIHYQFIRQSSVCFYLFEWLLCSILIKFIYCVNLKTRSNVHSGWSINGWCPACLIIKYVNLPIFLSYPTTWSLYIHKSAVLEANAEVTIDLKELSFPHFSSCKNLEIVVCGTIRSIWPAVNKNLYSSVFSKSSIRWLTDLYKSPRRFR